MHGRRGLEERGAISRAGINAEAAVRSARIVPELHHLAVAVKEFVEFHFPPVLHAEIIGSHGVLSAKSEPAFLHGLQHDLLDRLSVRSEDFDMRIDLRLRARRINIENDLLTGFRMKTEIVHIARCTNVSLDQRRKGKRNRRLRRFIVWLCFDNLGWRVLRRHDRFFHDLRSTCGFCCRDFESVDHAIHPRRDEAIARRQRREHGRGCGARRPCVELRKRGKRPYFHSPVFRAGNEGFSVGGKHQSTHRALVRKSGGDERIQHRLFLRNKTPQMDSFVSARRDDVLAVAGKKDGVLLTERLIERVKPLTVGDPPELHSEIRAGRSEHLSIR